MKQSLPAYGAVLRWYKRSVERRFDDDDIDERTEEFPDPGLSLQLGVSAQFAFNEASEVPGPFVRVRIVMTLEQPNVSAVVDGGVEFRFSDVQGVTRDQVVDFVEAEGIPYVIGLERAIIAELTRDVGLPAAMVPIQLPPGLREGIAGSLVEV